MYIQSLQSSLADGTHFINIISDEIAKLTLKILDGNGMIAKKLITDIPEGNHQVPLALDELDEGNYIINAFNGDTFIKSIRYQKK